jgi:hypothetical protein
MSKLLISRQHGLANGTNKCSICMPDNITILPNYINDSSSYQVSRCNYCGKEWAEFWISYRYVFSSLIYRHQHRQHLS